MKEKNLIKIKSNNDYRLFYIKNLPDHTTCRSTENVSYHNLKSEETKSKENTFYYSYFFTSDKEKILVTFVIIVTMFIYSLV